MTKARLWWLSARTRLLSRWLAARLGRGSRLTLGSGWLMAKLWVRQTEAETRIWREPLLTLSRMCPVEPSLRRSWRGRGKVIVQ